VNSNGRTRTLRVVVGSEALLSSAGGSLLVQTGEVSGLRKALSKQLAPWRPARARHDPGKIVLDLAVAVALGGDCLADVGVVRAQQDLFGEIASDPTVSRLIAQLAADGPAALAALQTARATAWTRVWEVAAPVDQHSPLIIDLDATLVDAHSEKQGAQPTFKRGFGFAPLLAFADHGPGGTGECLAGLLRTGKATANNAADHIAVLTDALAQLPPEQHRRVLVRSDSGTGTHAFVEHMHRLGLPYSVGSAAPPGRAGDGRLRRWASVPAGEAGGACEQHRTGGFADESPSCTTAPRAVQRDHRAVAHDRLRPRRNLGERVDDGPGCDLSVHTEPRPAPGRCRQRCRSGLLALRGGDDQQIAAAEVGELQCLRKRRPVTCAAVNSDGHR
jgi:hypothetical protein